MAEGTYEYECMRAELLGMPKPDEEEFLAKQKERLEHQAEELDAKAVEELEIESEDLKNVSGGLDELNSILSITQKKINRFKSACGSLTNLLKIKVGNSDSESTSTDSTPMKESESELEEKTNDNEENSDSQSVSSSDTQVPVQNGARKNDLSKALDKQVDKLDSLLMKAENAHYSMAHQSKQMRKFLNK